MVRQVTTRRWRFRRALSAARRELRTPVPVQWNLIDPARESEQFLDQHVLITGAAGLIGSALVEAFVAQGAVVDAVDIDEQGLAALVDHLPDDSWSTDRLRTHVCDLRNPLAIAALAASIETLDILVNNAGTNGLVAGVRSTASNLWSEVLQVNLVGPALLTDALVPKLAAAITGSVVFVTSIHAVSSSKLPAYAASKAAGVKLMEDFAMQLAPQNIRVNAVGPGWVLADDADAGVRALAAQPLAYGPVPVGAVVQAVQFLADRSRSPVTTGQHLVVDGARTLQHADYLRS